MNTARTRSIDEILDALEALNLECTTAAEDLLADLLAANATGKTAKQLAEVIADEHSTRLSELGDLADDDHVSAAEIHAVIATLNMTGHHPIAAAS